MAVRDKFYRSYYKTQKSRHDSGSLKEAVINDYWIMSHELIPILPSDKQSAILDLGCGYGSLLSLLKQHGYSCIKGVDISEEQVQKAMELGVTEVMHNDLFNYLSSDSSTYDCILGIDIIEHFDKDELVELLALIKSRLNQNGSVIFRTPNGDAPFGSTFYFGDFTHEMVLNYSSAEQIMLTADFKNVSILPSCVKVPGVLKNLLRSILWPLVKLGCKVVLFSSGKSTKNLLLTPNLIISAIK